MKADVPLWPEARTGDKVVLRLLNILKGVCVGRRVAREPKT